MTENCILSIAAESTKFQIALMRDDVTISLVTSKRGLVVMLSR